VLVFLVKNGELLDSIAEQAKAAGVENAAIVSLIGAADSFTISTMRAVDARKDVVTTYDLPAEMHGTGEINDGVVHIHAAMAVEGDRAIAGHLRAAQIGTWFARAYVTPID
jgi:predicted DNA-binding protein with PD1-like motif